MFASGTEDICCKVSSADKTKHLFLFHNIDCVKYTSLTTLKLGLSVQVYPLGHFIMIIECQHQHFGTFCSGMQKTQIMGKDTSRDWLNSLYLQTATPIKDNVFRSLCLIHIIFLQQFYTYKIGHFAQRNIETHEEHNL